MKPIKIIFMLCVIISALSLTACGKHDTSKQDVTRYMDTLIQAASATKSAEKLTDSTVAPVTYEGDQYRNPFELPTAVKSTREYPNAVLKDIALENLKLIGVMLRKDKNMAIFRTNEGKVVTVMQGMRVGLQQALLSRIENNQVVFAIDANQETGEKSHDIVMTVGE